MPDQNFKKQFINRMRRSGNLLPWTTGKPYKNLLFRQYAGFAKEIAVLGESLSTKMGDPDFERGLMNRLKKCDMRALEKMIIFIHAFEAILYSYARKEPYASGYYDRLLALLIPFGSLINSYRENALQPLLDHLSKTTDAGADADDDYIDRNEEMEKIWTETKKFAERIKKFRDRVDYFQRNDSPFISNKSARKVERYTRQLMEMLEDMLSATLSTRSQVKKCYVQQFMLELQEMYN